ncbi:MAG: hypothetical protein FWG66_12085 [Spirochaetes bacterium]|nr:hypothetical protein [Spirochaetota bacterium]
MFAALCYHYKVKLKTLAITLAASVFFSCAAGISGPLRADGSAEIAVNASLEPHIVGLIRNLAILAGIPPDQALLDGAQIAQAMTEAPGVESARLENLNPTTVQGQVRISQVSGFLDGGGGLPGAARFAVFEQGAQGGQGGRLEININRENGQEILALLSPDVVSYLSVLMAPLATGENLSRNEYLFLVGAVFSSAIANEIAGSRLRASIEFPAQVRGVRGGSFSGNRADFDIPLVDLLVLESPLSFEVTW